MQIRFIVDLRAGELRSNGDKIKLGERPLQILAALLEHPGEVVTREELRQKIWPADTFVDFEHGINTAVNKLRVALEDNADRPRFIETLPRHGYRFIAPVVRGDGTGPDAGAGPAPPTGAEKAAPLPIHLATWQRSDWHLLIAAVIGFVIFLVLFYRFHPASASTITVDAEQQRQITADTLKKLQWDVEVGNPTLWFSPSEYYLIASIAGNRAAQHRNPGIARWGGRLKGPEGNGQSLTGYYSADGQGKLDAVTEDSSPVGFSHPGPAPDEAAMGRMKEVALSAARKLYGEDLSAIKPLAQPYWYPPGKCWGASFSWLLPHEPPGLETRLTSRVVGSQVTAFWRWTGEARDGPSFDWYGYSPPARYFLAGLAMVVFVLVLFVARRVFREPQSPQNLRLVILIGLGGTVAASPALRDFGWPGEPRILSELVWGVITFCLFTLLSYALLNTVLYYLRRRFPTQIANYLQLFRERVFAKPSGLELLRGIFAGVAFSGVWMALVSLGGLWGKTLVGTAFWLSPAEGARTEAQAYILDVVWKALWPGSYGDVGVPLSPFQARVFPVLLIGEVLLVSWLMVALPLSLLSKATVRRNVLLAALSAAWLALGFSLAGAMVFPTSSYLIFVVLQAIFCGLVFLRYGLLATLSAVFTIEVGLLAFPLLEIFQNIDPLPYAIPVVLWSLLFMAAAGLYFRPQVADAYGRLAKVFE